MLWSFGSYSAWYTTKPKDGNWTVPTRLFSNEIMHDIKVAVDQAGVVHLVASTENGSEYTRLSGGQWSPPSSIDISGSNFDLQVDGEGTLHLLWKGILNVKYGVNYSSKLKDGGWSASRRISTGEIGSTMFLRIDPDGTLHGLWSISNSVLNYSIKKPGEDWGTPEIFSFAGMQSVLASVLAFERSASSEKIAIIYHGMLPPFHSVRYYYIERSAGLNWSEPLLLSPKTEANRFSLAAGPDGAFHVSWYEPNPNNTSTVNLGGVILYRKNNPAFQAGDAILSQTLNIPVGPSASILSFFYHLEGASAEKGTGLTVQVQAPGAPPTCFLPRPTHPAGHSKPST